MCPHPLASVDCAIFYALLAAPCALAAIIFALSLLLRRGPRGESQARYRLALAGVLPSSLVVSALASWLFLRLDLFRSRHDPRLVFGALLALTLGGEWLYVRAARPGR